MKRFLILFLALTFFCLHAAAQPPQQVASAIHFQHTIKSQVVGEDRTILVRVPQGYARGSQRYPVVYMLDAHPPQNAMMVGMIEQQVWGDVMPDVILVGIQNTNRTRDMTPTPEGTRGGGGADKFLRFIETEVVPYVDKNYRTEPYRVIAGHSLAGLFVVYTLAERPDLFNAYVAASPHLIWDKGWIMKRAEEAFKKGFASAKVFFAGVGDEPQYMETFNGLQEMLKRSKPKNLEFEFRQFKEENHGSVVLPVYYAGLRKVYAGWPPPQTGTLADVENHYRKLTSRYGYAVKVPEQLMNQIAYRSLRAGTVDEAIEIFKKNVENYPDSANVYDSLGEAYERAGQKSKARELYEKAWKMAEQNGDSQFAPTYKANFERVSAK